MNQEDRPTEVTIEPPFVAAAQFEEFLAFLVALGYQIVTVQRGADGFGGEVVVQTTAAFCSCCAIEITVPQLQQGGRCDHCRDEACISAAGEVPSGHGRFAYLFMGGPFKGRIVTSRVEPLFSDAENPLNPLWKKLGISKESI